MIFQTLDDKSECIRVYTDGQLHFNSIPDNLTTTWKYSGSLSNSEVEFVGLWTNGLDLEDCCPEQYATELKQCRNKLEAYLKSFKIAKINMRDHCIFDMIPQDFLMRFCEVKNKITEHVKKTWKRPDNYKHLADVSVLLHKIKYQNLNLSTQDCRHLLTSSRDRDKAKTLISNYRQIDYNLFGTVTGRLTTRPSSFPILTLRKDLRQMIKPQNDLFVCLDYNGAEVRTLLELCGEEQPNIDIHKWNSQHLFEQDPTSTDITSDHYDRKKVLDNWYEDGYISTPYGRKIQVEERKALNYLLQSTTSDRVLSKAVKIDTFLIENNCKSYISHIVHDEIVLDYSDGDRKWIPQIKEIFEDGYPCNLTAGKDYYNLKELKI